MRELLAAIYEYPWTFVLLSLVIITALGSLRDWHK